MEPSDLNDTRLRLADLPSSAETANIATAPSAAALRSGPPSYRGNLIQLRRLLYVAYQTFWSATVSKAR
jgi:hypothetical protein